jgi:hypothetical protein
MKTKSRIAYLPFALISSSCSSNKIIDNDTLFNTTWELEFIEQVFHIYTYKKTNYHF